MSLILTDDDKQWLDAFIERAVAAVQTAGDETIDRLQKVAAGEIDRAATEVGNVVQGVELALQATVDSALAKIAVQIGRLDGATVTPGTITVKLGA